MTPVDPPNPHQKARRIRIAPGSKWASADGGETAVVTSIEQTVLWGGQDHVTVRFERVGADGKVSLDSCPYDEFLARFPTAVA